MRIAVIADVHANLPALEAVMEELERERVQARVCLGDLVGYYAQPSECLQVVRAHMDFVVAGNHDRDTLKEGSAGTGSHARVMQRWTGTVLDQPDLDYLSELPSHVVQSHFVAAHGAYLSNVFVSGYVTSTMLEENLQAIAARPEFPQLALCGHTHVPMLGSWDGKVTQESALTSKTTYPANARAVLVNPGSVGQPRDGDPRAAFAVIDLDARSVEVRRVNYDVERTVLALKAAGLSTELGDRLREGR